MTALHIVSEKKERKSKDDVENRQKVQNRYNSIISLKELLLIMLPNKNILSNEKSSVYG